MATPKQSILALSSLLAALAIVACHPVSAAEDAASDQGEIIGMSVENRPIR